MTAFEIIYLMLDPFFPPLNHKVRKKVKELIRDGERPFQILDVGGRKSPYTIGVPAEITVSDLPRESNIQKELNLGINDDIIKQNISRRSNLKEVVYDDMTQSKLEDCSFDCVVAVEVLEHVELDEDFVKEVCRVLKPGGAFVMTTPNGDFVENHNPDHKRHYSRQELDQRLSAVFESTRVDYSIRGGETRRLGIRSFSLKHPIRTMVTMTANILNRIYSRGDVLKDQASGTHHLFAVARKGDSKGSNH